MEKKAHSPLIKFIVFLFTFILCAASFIGGIYFREWPAGEKALETSGIIQPHECPSLEGTLFEVIDNGDGTFTIRPKA